jgi:hypothetical protein
MLSLQRVDQRSVTSENREARPTAKPKRPVLRREIAIGVAVLMLVEALSLAVASGLHLGGLVSGRSPTFDPDTAGLAEAIIGAVLVVGAVVMLRSPHRARTVGIGANAFALVGFLIGITETASGGHAPDIAYHLTVIPLLVISLVLLLRRNSSEPPAPSGAHR